MEFRVLGPLELWGPGDTKINLASGAQRRLTSFLVQRANTIVPAETLEEHLGLTPGALRTSVSRLRRLVGFDTLITAPPGYTLRTDRIDATQFDALVALARSSNDRTARDALAAAVTLWRGDAYGEFAHEEWAAAEVARLTDLRACAVEDLAQMNLEAGEATSAITMLEPLIATYPFRDRPRGLLMRALADAGRRTDALREFQAYRQLLGGGDRHRAVAVPRRAGSGNRGPDRRSRQRAAAPSGTAVHGAASAASAVPRLASRPSTTSHRRWARSSGATTSGRRSRS